MTTCPHVATSYINQDCFSSDSSANKNYVHLPVVSNGQTGWKQDEATCDNVPCLADTLYMPGEKEAQHILWTGFTGVVLQSQSENMSCIWDISRSEFHTTCLKAIHTYSYLFISTGRVRKLWCDTVTLPKPLSLFWACDGLRFWLLSQYQYPPCRLLSPGDNSYGSKLVPQNVVVYHWQTTSSHLSWWTSNSDPVLIGDFRSSTKFDPWMLTEIPPSLLKHAETQICPMPRASASTLSPLCQCFSSWNRYDWYEWEKMARLEFRRLSVRCDLALMVGDTKISKSDEEPKHLWHRLSTNISWPGSRPFSAWRARERFWGSLCVSVSWDSCGLFAQKASKIRLAVRCCGGVGMSAPRWQAQMQRLNEVAAMSDVLKRGGATIRTLTLLRKSSDLKHLKNCWVQFIAISQKIVEFTEPIGTTWNKK